MTEQQTNLLTFYKGWDVYQDHLIEAIALLTADQLALRAVPHLCPIGENTAHIVGTRIGWFHKPDILHQILGPGGPLGSTGAKIAVAGLAALAAKNILGGGGRGGGNVF